MAFGKSTRSRPSRSPGCVEAPSVSSATSCTNRVSLRGFTINTGRTFVRPRVGRDEACRRTIPAPALQAHQRGPASWTRANNLRDADRGPRRMGRRGQASGMRDGYMRGALSRAVTRRQLDVLAAYVAAGGPGRGRVDGHSAEYGQAPPRRPACEIGPHHRAADLRRTSCWMACCPEFGASLSDCNDRGGCRSTAHSSSPDRQPGSQAARRRSGRMLPVRP